MKNNKLAIAVPTYNRAKILEENINLMFDEIKKNAIPIYISDDSNNDDTKILVKKFKLTYPYIYYSKNQPSLGHDKNCINTLSLPTEEYIWYLGDSMIIQPGGIERILDNIKKVKPQILSVNSAARNLKIKSKIYKDGSLLLKELGWYLTMTGATIYSKAILKNIQSLNLDKFTNFPQLAIIFDCFANYNCSLYWESENLITNNINKTSYWKKDVFQVFISDWTSIINNLDTKFSIESKKTAIRSHSINTGIFNMKSLISYRYRGYFNYKIFIRYFKELKMHSNVNIFFIGITSIVPRIFFIIPVLIYKRFIK